MSDAIYSFVRVDMLPLLTATFAAVTCGLLGNFLVLRRLSLMGDAISHAVLPGLVIAFLVSGFRNPLPMFLGAAIAGIATVVLVEVVQKLGRVEPGAAMGVVFSILFALGVLLIEQASARHVDLDADCVLHGQLETLFWFPPQDWGEFISWSTFLTLPRQVTTLAGMMIASFMFISIFYKELRIAAFDPELATTQGFHAGLMHYLLMIIVAAATVASFEAVGSILVIAMLIGPAATARMLTGSLLWQIIISVMVAIICGSFGYASATAIPAVFGLDSVNAAGMMAVVAGVTLTLAIIFSPQFGMITKTLRWRKLSMQIALDDLLGALYRLAESGAESASITQLATILQGREIAKGTSQALRRGLVSRFGDMLKLTTSGHKAAATIVRRHRLWESYLVDRAEMLPTEVHDQAEQLEHVALQPPGEPVTDPHGRPIPRDREDRERANQTETKRPKKNKP